MTTQRWHESDGITTCFYPYRFSLLHTVNHLLNHVNLLNEEKNTLLNANAMPCMHEVNDNEKIEKEDHDVISDECKCDYDGISNEYNSEYDNSSDEYDSVSDDNISNNNNDNKNIDNKNNNNINYNNKNNNVKKELKVWMSSATNM